MKPKTPEVAASEAAEFLKEVADQPFQIDMRRLKQNIIGLGILAETSPDENIRMLADDMAERARRAVNADEINEMNAASSLAA